ncbi:MAG: hypothetical protein Ct9H300mP16_13480 [Pseudomonadota bacterium]|nr:MAG: hypothetical protein Ct9H300mP16_13480 [Pseudomonadota bacterium]
MPGVWNSMPSSGALEPGGSGSAACAGERPAGVGSLSREVLDARHFLCPLPVIRAQDRVKALQPGDILEVRCTDPGALSDIPAWCRINGHLCSGRRGGERGSW